MLARRRAKKRNIAIYARIAGTIYEGEIMAHPSWQQQPCPSWCTTIHREEDYLDDRAHRDQGVDVPVVIRKRRVTDKAISDWTEATYLTIGRWQRDGESEEWIYRGDNQGQEIELSRDSFRRIAETLQKGGFDPDLATMTDAA